jgi:hypothetical protein
LPVNLNGKAHFGKPRHRWDIILKWNLKEGARIWTRFIWLRRGLAHEQ